MAVAALSLAACYPRYDWRDYRPDCAKAWCGFVASFPGKATSATRDIPVGSMRLPLTVHVVSVGDVRFAITVFELLPGSDVAAARETLERKLVDDVGATDVRRGRVTMHAADRSDIAASTFTVEGSRSGEVLEATARFIDRRDRLVEMLVIGPADRLHDADGRQQLETFFSSMRLD